MFGKLFLLFTLVTLLETYLLYVSGATLGVWWTVGLIVFTALLGAFLTKREGLKMWHAWKDALGEGRMPEEGLLDGVLVLVGAVLLMTPGVLTDLTGIFLLIPPTRRWVVKYLRPYLEKRFIGSGQVTQRVRVDLGNGHYAERVQTTFGGFSHLHSSSSDPNVIDVEGEVVEEIRHGDRDAARLEETE